MLYQYVKAMIHISPIVPINNPSFDKQFWHSNGRKNGLILNTPEIRYLSSFNVLYVWALAIAEDQLSIGVEIYQPNLPKRYDQNIS